MQFSGFELNSDGGPDNQTKTIRKEEHKYHNWVSLKRRHGGKHTLKRTMESASLQAIMCRIAEIPVKKAPLACLGSLNEREIDGGKGGNS